ncbi:MAG: hypothetical protein ACO1N5_04655 [Noviherbaspirillum sp.]
MYIVAIGWLYVALMMAITEESVVAGAMTFLLYGAVPVGLILYIGDSRRRRERRAAREMGKPEKPGKPAREGEE